jgi:putative CocE/NonD family hydrolase
MTSTRVQSSLEFINSTWPDAYNLAIKNPMGKLVEILGWPDQIWQLFNTELEDSLWERYDVGGKKQLKTRICLIGAWYDFLLNATLKTYDDLISRGGIKPDLIIGPWSHNGYLASQAGSEDWEFGKEGIGNFIQDMSELFEREKTNAPQLIRIFILRSNKWIDLDSWPPSQIEEKKLYLQKNNVLSENFQDDELLELDIEANFDNPVPTLGGIVWESFDPIEPGPRDQKSLCERNDVLMFYTNSLADGLTLLGPSSVDLWIKAEAEETHFTAKLVIVESDGTERIFQDGILRVLGPIDEYKKITIDLLSTGITLNKNEKLGLEISWSNFPKYALPSINKSSKQYVALSKETPSCLRISSFKAI